jgi:putative selenate reductase
VRTIDGYVVKAFAGAPAGRPDRLDDAIWRVRGGADDGDLEAAAGPALLARWAAATALHNTAHHVPRVTADARYAYAANKKPPRKLGSHLALFDCVTCSKCIPVCPNDANFTFALAPATQPIVFVKHDGAGWVAREAGALTVTREVQFANFADFCNECGNCDVFCPEDGGPYAIKPRFFGSAADWRLFATKDGFAIEVVAGVRRVLGRIDGRELAIEAVIEAGGERVRYTGPGFAVTLDPGDPVATLDGWADSLS